MLDFDNSETLSRRGMARAIFSWPWERGQLPNHAASKDEENFFLYL